jgi:hypothetical protein
VITRSEPPFFQTVLHNALQLTGKRGQNFTVTQHQNIRKSRPVAAKSEARNLKGPC